MGFLLPQKNPHSKLCGRYKFFAIVTVARNTPPMAQKRTPRAPWNDWYHCMFHTYGTWLPGDGRGFRTRHHRRHVDGDYKHPPSEDFTALHAHSLSLLKRAPVRFTVIQRPLVRDALLKSLMKWNVELIALSVDAIHVHLLARFPQHDPRRFVGLAKKESSAFLPATDGLPTGGLWGARCQCEPIASRAHQVSTVHYILKHQQAGAAVHFQKRAN